MFVVKALALCIFVSFSQAAVDLTAPGSNGADCVALDACLNAVAEDAKCKCDDETKTKKTEFFKCMTDNGSTNKCPTSTACASFKNCKLQVAECYEKHYHFDSNKEEMTYRMAFQECTIKKKCIDNHLLCPFWRKGGLCDKEFKAFMTRDCLASCDEDCQKTDKFIKVENCTDSDERCSDLASKGLCQTDRYWSIWKCQASCALCAPGEGFVHYRKKSVQFANLATRTDEIIDFGVTNTKVDWNALIAADGANSTDTAVSGGAPEGSSGAPVSSGAPAGSSGGPEGSTAAGSEVTTAAGSGATTAAGSGATTAAGGEATTAAGGEATTAAGGEATTAAPSL